MVSSSSSSFIHFLLTLLVTLTDTLFPSKLLNDSLLTTNTPGDETWISISWIKTILCFDQMISTITSMVKNMQHTLNFQATAISNCTIICWLNMKFFPYFSFISSLVVEPQATVHDFISAKTKRIINSTKYWRWKRIIHFCRIQFGFYEKIVGLK